MVVQLAGDDYEITRQQNALSTALLTLKQLMNYPETDTLLLAGTLVDERIGHTTEYAENPDLEAAQYNVVVARRNLSIAKGALSPSISISGGMSTSYNKMLHNPTTGFHDQLRNNKGEYVYASLSIPLFNRMETISHIRRQRNNLRIAEEQLAQKRDELTKLQLQALNDCEGYRKQTIQMRKKVEADSIAARLTTRKYEEGLSSAIDVQTSNATLLESRAQLLQCQLMLALKQKLVNYYKGIALWTER